MKIFTIIFIVLFFNNVCYSDYIQDLKKDADSGDPIAQNNYGYTLIYGLDGTEENDELGMEYIRKAANQGQVNSMTTLGWNYFTGEDGVKKDFDKAVYWTKKAADLGTHGMPTYNLGLFYFQGLAGLPQDLNQAKKKWNLACKQWPNNNSYSPPQEILEEINTYSKNLNRKMLKIRDNFIACISSIES